VALIKIIITTALDSLVALIKIIFTGYSLNSSLNPQDEARV